MDDETLASIFEEKDKKKKTRLERKMEKKKEKEKKIYNDFIDEQKKKKEEKIEEPEKTVSLKTTKIETVTEENDDEMFENIKPQGFAYSVFFGFFTLMALFSSIGYLVYAYLKNLDQNHLINGGILTGFTFFYMLSSLSKKNGIKKFFGILASLAMMGFIGFQLFIL